MTERERVQFQDGSERMLVQLTKQQRWERGATATPSALRQQRQLGGLAEAVEQKKTLKDEGYKTNQKFHRQRLFLKDQKTISIGAVLKEQTPLVRREVFRRRLFPIRFEESARSVEEVQQLLMQRKPLGQLMISVCYLAVLLVFISYSLEVNRIFEAANGVSSPIKSALAPTASSFNSLSYEVAKAEGTTPTPADFSESGHPADMLMMSSKAGVASWLLYGFVPLLYGPSPQTSNLGSARVIGNCFRLTFRQVELEGVNGFDLGYEGGWPLAAAEASSSIAASKLRSDNPLVNPPGSRFTYSYPFASPGEYKSFNQSGGHYQVICKDSIQDAQTALQQNQSPSRYPPWFVPLPVIADRRTISTVVDFFVINPATTTFSHCAILFSFTSSGTLLRPLVWVSSLIPFSAQSDGVVRYTSLGLLLALLIFSLLWEYGESKKMGFKSWCQRGRTRFLIFHLLLLLGFLASFVCVQVIALLAPKLELAVAASGYYNILSAPSAAGETGFFQLVSDYGHLFRLSSITQQVCAILGALVALTGCVLIAMLSPAMAGSGTKSLQMTLRKVKFYMLACSIGLLSIVLIFVSLGNISFGAATRSFAGYYESLTTSAAFLLGGTLGNYDVYTMSSVNSILAGIFFVPLFLVFSAFGFTILTAVVLRKHNLCADSVQQGVLKYKLEKQDLFQTRYEWLRHAMASGCSSFWTALRGCWKPQRISVLEEESHEGFQDDVEEAAASKKERTNKKFRSRWREKGKDPIEREQHAEKKHLSIEEDDDSPPQYPSWVWQAMGMEDPINMYSLGSGEKKSFYVDPASVDSYFKTYGYFRGFGMTGMKESSDCYFQPDIPTTLVDENPAPSVDKVYILVRNQSREDHEDAWKKLFVVAFVAITVATVSLQLSIDTSADIRDMAGRAVAKTGFSLDPVTLACEDTALGLANVNFSIRFPIQHVFSITSPRSLYSWLKSDQGLMALFSCHASSPLFNQTFPQSTLVDGTYQQPVLCNWNAAITTRSIRVTLNTRSESIYPVQLGFTCESLQCVYQPLFENTTFRDFLKGLGEQDILRDVGTELAFHTFLLSPNSGNMILELLLSFRRDSGGTVAPSLSVESWKLQPYATWDFATVAAVALQVASAALFLFFGCSFFVEFCRLRRKLKEEREDYSFGLCLGVFFVDDLFNAFDIIGFIVLACAILVWVLHVCSSPHSEVFTLADDLVTASATAASGATEETEATTAAGVLFEAFSSASALMGTYAQLAAAIMAAAFLRLLRIGRKHKRMTMMFYALASSAEEMIQVLIGTVLLFLGFSYLCFLAFGRHMENYSTVKNSFISTIMLTTGFFPLSQLFQSDALMAGAFVFPYLFFMGIICFSLFLSVLLRSLAYRSAEIRAMERLQKIEHRSVLRSAKLFFEELMCNFRVRKEILEEQQKEIQLKHLQEQANAATDFRKRIATERQDSSAELRKSEEAERKRREKPLKVVELPPDVVTSALSDAQYAALPEDIRFFANQEAVLFVDRFRAMATQLKLSSGNIVSLLHQLENEAYTELLKLSREVAQQEGHLRHEASVYTSQVGTGQQRLTAYAKYVEKALQEREEELQLQEHELKLLEARMEGDLQEAERYGGDS